MNDEKLIKPNKSQVIDKEVKKDLDRSENEGYAVMYESEKKKQRSSLSSEGKENRIRVKDIMSKDPVYCTADTNLEFVAKLMLEHDCGEIPIVNNEVDLQPVGVITDRDIVCRSVAAGKNPLVMTARECMSRPCITINPDVMIEDCCRILEENKIRRIPVVDERGCCCGIISQADIATHHLKNQIVEILEEVSQPNKNQLQ